MSWKNEPQRHAMSSRGIETRYKEAQRQQMIQRTVEEDIRQARFEIGKELAEEVFVKYGIDEVRDVVQGIKPGENEDYFINVSIPHNEPLLQHQFEGKTVGLQASDLVWFTVISKTEQEVVAEKIRTNLMHAIVLMTDHGVSLNQLGIKSVQVPKTLSGTWIDGRIYVETLDGRVFKTYGDPELARTNYAILRKLAVK